MAAYDTLRAAIDSYIKANGNKEITGTVLNDILNAMVSALGADTRFAGVAVPSTNPGNPEGNVVYFASQAGTYSNFGGIVLPLGIHILVWNGTAWTSQTWFSVDNTPTQYSQNLATSGGIFQAIVDAVGVERLRAIGVEVTSASFNSTTKKISFFNSANSTLFQLDATAFIIDGMVSDVKIENGNLVIKFNTDSGKQDIEIPLTDIFNPANYYTKTAIDTLLTLYYTKTETNALLTAINNKLADGCLYRGMAEPTTNPPTPTTKVFYIATKTGTYTNFGNISVTEGITILKYDGSNWSKEQISYSDGVFDISAYNGTSYADLSAALGSNGANIPQNLRKGGMSIKFVQSSDNKYVQYRLISDEWSTDTKKWTIADEGVYVENLEFVYVKTDKEDKILWAIKTDGTIYFGAGVPHQIIDYVEGKISELSLDEYEDIVTFLGSLIENDKTLQQLLDEKVDKEEGKSLIDSNVANSESSIISPEFFELKTDSENKIIEGFEKDGTKHVYVDEKVEGSVSVGGNLNINGYLVAHENRDGIETQEDADGKILEDTKSNGIKIHCTHNEFKQDVSFNGKAEVCNNIGANSFRESVTLNISSINALNPFEYYYPRLVNMGFPKKNTNTKPLVLCHISDVHGQQEQYDRIVEFLKLYDGLYDDFIITGDIVAYQYGDSISYLNAYKNRALLVIGNHDAWERNALPIVVVSAKDDYDKFIAPFIGNWDVTQPENASSGKCYYYKDYPQSKIRLIVTDCMHDSQDQTDFVTNALEGARQNEYGVIISQHYPAGNFTPSNVAFQSIDIDGNNIEHNDAYVDVVDTFIENGGKFICWLCGHHHVDLFGYLVGHPAQLQVCIDCTKFTSDFDTARLGGTKTQDVMNIYSFDVETGIFSILRVGATLDRHLQKKDSVIVDYINKSILV